MAKPFGQVGRGLPGLTSVCDRCRRLVGLPPIALLLQDGSVLAEPANIIWFEVDGNRYALAYNHGAGCIELRERTQSGKVLHRFTNKTPVIEVREVFQAL